MSRAAAIRESEAGRTYLLAKMQPTAQPEVVRECLAKLRAEFGVDDRYLLQALATGRVQGSKMGRPPKPRPCPHCGLDTRLDPSE